MTSKLKFVARFLAVFALLICVARLTDAPRGYAFLLKRCTAAASPAVSGWWLESGPEATGPELWFRKGAAKIRVQLSPEALSLGLLPLLSLLGATPRMSRARLAASALGGALALFALDLAVLLIYPLLVLSPSAATDIAGTFLGLLVFVGAPVILWFALTFDRLGDVWRLDEPFAAR